MPDLRDKSVAQLLYHIVCAVVDRLGEVKIETWWDDEETRLTIYVHPDDLGKLLGKHGHTIKSIRLVILGAGAKYTHLRRYKVIIAEQRPD